MSKNDLFVFELDGKEFAGATGKQFRGMSINVSGGEWTCVVRGLNGDNSPVYAIGSAESAQDAFHGLLDALCSEYAHMFWRKDTLNGVKKR